jgi:hypothetical protein
VLYVTVTVMPLLLVIGSLLTNPELDVRRLVRIPTLTLPTANELFSKSMLYVLLIATMMCACFITLLLTLLIAVATVRRFCGRDNGTVGNFAAAVVFYFVFILPILLVWD